MIWIYRAVWIIIGPIIDIWFIKRLYKGKEDFSRIKERLGFSELSRPIGKLVWIHGASVGETLSILPLVKKLLAKDAGINILVTSGTRTSAKLMAKLLPKGAIHQYVPLDFVLCISEFVNHWQPDVSVFVESEFWPEMMHQAPNPILINARISERSARRHKKFGWFMGGFISNFVACLGQTEGDVERLKLIGAKNVSLGGNLKFDSQALTVNKEELATLKSDIGKRPVFVAAATHDGEDELLAAIALKLRDEIPNLLTIIAPRHPERGNSIVKQIDALNIETAQRSIGEPVTEETNVLVADTIGEMGLWYSLADVVFVGGSIIPHGGQNPLEPLKFAVPTVCGQHMFNFKDMINTLKENNLVTQIEQVEEIYPTLLKEFKTPSLDKKALKAKLEGLGGATDKAAELILNRLGG